MLSNYKEKKMANSVIHNNKGSKNQLECDSVNHVNNYILSVVEKMRKKKSLKEIFENSELYKISNIVNVKTKLNGMTLLHCAVLLNNEEVVKELLKHNPNVNAEDNFKKTPLHYVKNNRIAQLLINHGANMDAENDLGHCIMIDAYVTNNMQLIKLLIENGADTEGIKKACGFKIKQCTQQELIDFIWSSMNEY